MSNDLNSVLIEGNMMRDPVLLNSGLCKIIIASNRYFKKNGKVLEHEVSYFDVEISHKLVQFCMKNGRKGKKIKVTGRLRQDHYDDNDSKLKFPVVVIEAEHIDFQGKLK